MLDKSCDCFVIAVEHGRVPAVLRPGSNGASAAAGVASAVRVLSRRLYLSMLLKDCGCQRTFENLSAQLERFERQHVISDRHGCCVSLM